MRLDSCHIQGTLADQEYLIRIRRKRPALRLIVSSATLDAAAFHEYFTEGPESSPDNAVIVSLEGRMFPVEVAYLQDSCADYVTEAVRVVWEIHLKVCD